jgi:hypothetical protein
MKEVDSKYKTNESVMFVDLFVSFYTCTTLEWMRPYAVGGRSEEETSIAKLGGGSTVHHGPCIPQSLLGSTVHPCNQSVNN